MKITINYKVKKVDDNMTLLPNFKIQSWRRKYKRDVNLNVIDGGHFVMSLKDEDITLKKKGNK